MAWHNAYVLAATVRMMITGPDGLTLRMQPTTNPSTSNNIYLYVVPQRTNHPPATEVAKAIPTTWPDVQTKAIPTTWPSDCVKLLNEKALGKATQ